MTERELRRMLLLTKIVVTVCYLGVNGSVWYAAYAADAQAWVWWLLAILLPFGLWNVVDLWKARRF